MISFCTTQKKFRGPLATRALTQPVGKRNVRELTEQWRRLKVPNCFVKRGETVLRAIVNRTCFDSGGGGPLHRCGFHGNPEWEGYCSKCHAERILETGRQPVSSVGTKITHGPVRPASLSFGSFEDKKKTQKASRK